MKRLPAAETALAQGRARRIRIVTTSTVAAIVVALLLVAAWAGTTRMSVSPSVLANDPRILGSYLVPIDGAFDLAAGVRLEGDAAGRYAASLRAERARFRHILFGYAEIAFLERDQWAVYVPTRVHTGTIREPLEGFLESTGVLREAGTARPGAVGEYSLLPDGVLVTSPGLDPLPARVRTGRGGDARVPPRPEAGEWRYATRRGYFPPELEAVARVAATASAGGTSETLVVWREFHPRPGAPDPPAAEVHPGVGDLLSGSRAGRVFLVSGVLPLFHDDPVTDTQEGPP